MQLGLYLSIAVLVLCIVMAHRIAQRKGLKPLYWGVMAGIFGPLVFPVLLLIKARPKNSEQAEERGKTPDA